MNFLIRGEERIDPIRSGGRGKEGRGRKKFVELLGVSGVTGERYRRLSEAVGPASSQRERERERGPGVSIGRDRL